MIDPDQQLRAYTAFRRAPVHARKIMTEYEVLCKRCCPCQLPESSDEGLSQFRAYESRGGLKPTQPYGVALLEGKRWLEWTVNEYAARYGTSEWPGWDALQHDMAESPLLLRMICQRLRVEMPRAVPADLQRLAERNAGGAA